MYGGRLFLPPLNFKDKEPSMNQADQEKIEPVSTTTE